MEISKGKAELDVVQGEKEKFETQSLQLERYVILSVQLQLQIRLFFHPGPSCSKLTMLLVNISLKL